MKRFIIITAILLSISTVLYATEFLGTIAGDANDALENTFHFNSENVNFQMLSTDNTVLTAAQVPYVAGSAFKLFNDGEDWIQKRNLGVLGADLSAANWTSTSYPTIGNVSIDPALGRIKFAASGWQTGGIIDPGNASDSDVQDIVMNDSGLVICVYTYRPASNDRCYANVYLPESGWQGPQIIDAGDFAADDPQIAINSSGQAVCVFVQSDGANTRIYANQYQPGAGWQGPVLIDRAAGTNASSPDVDINESGQIIAGFIEFFGGVDRIFGQAYDLTTGWGTAGNIDPSAGNLTAPRVAINASGRAMLAYSGNTLPERIYVNRWNGSSWITPAIVSPLTNDATNARIAYNDNEDAICSFQQDGSSHGQVWAAHYLGPFSWDTPVAVDAAVGYDASFPEIAINSSGMAVVGFDQYDGSYNRMAGNVYLPGSSWQTAQYIDFTNDQYVKDREVAINSAGYAFSVYTQSNGSEYHSYATQYVPGAGWQSAQRVDHGQAYDCYRPQCTINTQGTAFSAYIQEGVSGNLRLYAAQYKVESPRGNVQVNYYAPTATMTITAEHACILETRYINSKIEPTRGEKFTIEMYLGEAGHVSVKVYNLMGQLVKVLKDEYTSSGTHTIEWGGENIATNLVASGVYIVHIQTPLESTKKKVVVIK
jgi:Secretion system C-terminal sorting domain